LSKTWVELKRLLREVEKPPSPPSIEVNVEEVANRVFLKVALKNKRVKPEALREIIRESVERNWGYIQLYYEFNEWCNRIEEALARARELEHELKGYFEELAKAYGSGYPVLKTVKAKGRRYTYPVYRVIGSKRDIYLSKGYVTRIRRLLELKRVVRELNARAIEVCREVENTRRYLESVGLLP